MNQQAPPPSIRNHRYPIDLIEVGLLTEGPDPDDVRKVKIGQWK